MSLTLTVDATFPITTVILSHVKALDLCFGRHYSFRSSLVHSLIYCLSTNADGQVDKDTSKGSFHLHKDIISNQPLPQDPQPVKQLLCQSLFSCPVNKNTNSWVWFCFFFNSNCVKRIPSFLFCSEKSGTFSALSLPGV